MRTITRSCLAFPLAAFLLLHAAPPAVNTGKAGMDAEILARIPARMKAFVDKGTLPGVVTLVQRHGALAQVEAVGYRDLETKQPMRTDTIFRIASMTKPFTAVGIMILMEEGRLALRDPVEKYLPEFKNMWVIESREGDKNGDTKRVLRHASRPITLRDLLTHTSGMYGMPPETLDEAIARKTLTLSEVALMASQKPLDFDPGTKWQYSNYGIAVLGRIIEIVADQPYDKFIESRVFQPLGMKDSFFFLPADRRDRVATVYVLDKGKLQKADWDFTDKDAKYPFPEGGMYSTALDLAAFYQMMLNGGSHNGKRILSRATVDMMTEVHTGELSIGQSAGMGYGLAWAIVRTPDGTLPLASIGTYGHGGAFGTYGWVDPKKDLVGVFLVQQPDVATERSAFMAMAASAINE
ncbi:MAG TPA: serine hydrolase domain-containing protein [Bryobacteraceae bacterium]|nr:serine hydrolase domain-containing protein [Bryobacteraceae bacterium]